MAPQPDDRYRAAAAAIALRVEDFATDEMLDELDLTDPFELSGLYEGTPLTEKSVMDQPHGPDTIWLFRRAIQGFVVGVAKNAWGVRFVKAKRPAMARQTRSNLQTKGLVAGA